jgi:hypothetical protein
VSKLQSSDRWRHRHFGMTMSGVAGGVALKRHNASTLVSIGEATTFEVSSPENCLTMSD